MKSMALVPRFASARSFCPGAPPARDAPGGCPWRPTGAPGQRRVHPLKFASIADFAGGGADAASDSDDDEAAYTVHSASSQVDPASSSSAPSPPGPAFH